MKASADSLQSCDRSSPASADAPARPVRRSFLREVPWRWRDLLIGFGPFLALTAANAFLAPVRRALVSSTLFLTLIFLDQSWMLVYPLWIAVRRVKAPPFLRVRAIFVEALFALMLLPGAFLIMAVLPPVLDYVIGGAMPTAFWTSVGGSFNRIEWLAFVILGVTVGPIAEEIFYRGMLYSALRQRLHVLVAAPLQGVVFGLTHYPLGLTGAVAVAVCGLVLALFYEWRRTLLAPILLHAFVNAAGMAAIAWTISVGAAAPRLGVVGESHEGRCIITAVAPGSGAEAAGLQAGDVVTSIDGAPVTDIQSMALAVRRKHLGETVVVEFLRAGEPHRVEAVLKRLAQ
jgi:membrane protease YdiL (CAAX protease family)